MKGGGHDDGAQGRGQGRRTGNPHDDEACGLPCQNNHGGGNCPGESGEQILTTYVTDTVIENADSGYDVVYAAITYSLTENVEELRLTGPENLDATGNDLDNRIVGNDGDNRLAGGLGNDFLEGGAGSDLYLFERGAGQDVIAEGDEVGDEDVIRFAEGIDRDDIALLSLDGNLRIGYGAGDQVDILADGIQGTGIERFELADGSYLTDADVNQLIQQMAAFAVDEGIAFSSLSDVRSNPELMTLVANAWHAG